MKSFLTDKKLLKNGGRKGSIISPEELEEKICKLGKSYGAKESENNSLLYSSVFQILCEDSQIKTDLSKITFDFENLDVEDEAYENTGFHTLDNGFSFLFGMAGGDWECAIGFIIYWDGKKLRGYVPTLGNTFNLKKKCAFGSEDDGDDIVDCFSAFVCEITGRPITSQELNSINYGEYYVNLELFKEDILSRIEIDAEEVEKYKKSLEEQNKKSFSLDSSTSSQKTNFEPGDIIYVAIEEDEEEYEVRECMFLSQINSSVLVLFKFQGYDSLESELSECMDNIDIEYPSGIIAVSVENCFATEEEAIEAFENQEYSAFDEESENDDLSEDDKNIEYYWQFDSDGCGKILIMVAKKKYFDHFGCLDDRGLNIPELEALGFMEYAESYYELDNNYKGEKTKKGIREVLKTLKNFKEYKMF